MPAASGRLFLWSKPMTENDNKPLLSGPEPQPNDDNQPLLLQPLSASEPNSAATAAPAGATKAITLTLPAEVADVAQQLLARAVDAVGGLLAPPPAAPAPSRSHPAAQALVAGILQGLGQKYGDRRMSAAGFELEQRARGLPVVAKPAGKPQGRTRGKRRRKA
jgi:hypothetical protein